MGGLIEFGKTIGGARLAAMGAVAVGLIGFFVFLILQISQPQMTTLFTELPIEDSNAVVTKLEGMNVPFELKNEGATVLVPKDRVLRLRMSLAEEGLPAGGSVGYEIFDKGDTLGATSFVQNLNHLRALEGELARTIRALDRIQMARVHLVIPKRQLFAKDKSEPTASIVLKMRGGLDRGQIKAIQHLVASAVKDLKPSHVSIVNENGALLASGMGEGDQTAMISSFEERNLAFERRLQGQIDNIVTSVVGRNNARVQVNAEIDYNRITQTSETYDPEGQVVRSTQSREESSNSRDGSGNGAVSVGNELPGAGDNAGGEKASAEAANKTEEVVNYEISKTTKQEVVEAGRIKKLSVAVLVDGLYTKGADGAAVYAPRAQNQLEQIATLVRSAVGFDRARGDVVEVINLQFAPGIAPAALEEIEASFLNLSKEDYFYIAELVVLLIVSLLVLLLVVRPLVRRIITPDAASNDAIDMEQLAAQVANNATTGSEAAEDMDPGAKAKAAAAALPQPESQASTLIEYAQMVGEAQGHTIKKVAELVQQNPDEAVSIIRQWIHEEAA